jgi:hypothetical protein
MAYITRCCPYIYSHITTIIDSTVIVCYTGVIYGMVYGGVMAATYCSVYTECYTCFAGNSIRCYMPAYRVYCVTGYRGAQYDMVIGCWLCCFGVTVYIQCYKSIYATACIRAGYQQTPYSIFGLRVLN